MTVIRCSVAQVPPVGLAQRVLVSSFGGGKGLYAPTLAGLMAAQPNWYQPGFNDSSWDELFSYDPLPSPYFAPFPGTLAMWHSDSFVKTEGFVTHENWAGRFTTVPYFTETVIGVLLSVVVTEQLNFIAFNGRILADRDTGFSDLTIAPSELHHDGVTPNVIAHHQSDDIALPYAMVAWKLVVDVATVPAFYPRIRASVPDLQRLRLVHHA